MAQEWMVTSLTQQDFEVDLQVLLNYDYRIVLHRHGQKVLDIVRASRRGSYSRRVLLADRAGTGPAGAADLGRTHRGLARQAGDSPGMRTIVCLYIRLKYLIRMDIPLWLYDQWFRVRLRFMSREQRQQELERGLRRLLLSSRFSVEEKQTFIEAAQVLRDADK